MTYDEADEALKAFMLAEAEALLSMDLSQEVPRLLLDDGELFIVAPNGLPDKWRRAQGFTEAAESADELFFPEDHA